MDVNTLLIGAAVCAVSAILIYLISFFSMREKTFEEVLEEQRRRQEEETKRLRSEKRAEKDKKKYRKSKDKPKEKAAQVSEPELKASKTVILVTEPEKTGPVDAVGLETKIKSPKGKKAQKSAPVNKNEKVGNVAKAEPGNGHQSAARPKDVVDVKHQETSSFSKSSHSQQKQSSPPQEQQQQQGKSRKGEDGKPTERKQAAEKVKADSKASERKSAKTEDRPPVHEQLQSMPDEKRSSKGKASTHVTEGTSNLITSLKGASLNDTEVQTLVDILHNKQKSGNVEWNKKTQKNDPVPLLRKQLEEKESALQEERKRAVSSTNKLKEVQHEVTREKTKCATLEKQYQEKFGQQAQEIQALQARMQHTHKQHLTETSNLQAQIKNLEKLAVNEMQLQKLVEENKMLKDSLSKSKAESISPSEIANLRQQVNIMQKELTSNVVKLTSSENSKKTLEQKVVKFEEKIHTLESERKNADVISKKLEEASQHLRKFQSRNSSLDSELQKMGEARKAAESQKTTLRNDLQKANNALKAAESECSLLKTKLKELEDTLTGSDSAYKEVEAKLKDREHQCIEKEGNVRNLEKKLESSNKRHSELEMENEVLQRENGKLTEQLSILQNLQAAAHRDDLEAKVKESESRRVEAESNVKNLENQVADYRQGQAELEQQIKVMKEEKRVLQEETKVVVERLAGEGLEKREEPAGAPNGDVQQEMVPTEVALVEHERVIGEKDGEINRLSSELKTRHTESLTRLEEKETKIRQLTTDINSQQMEIVTLKSEIEKQKNKNNELRAKNWKAMDALEKAEKSVKDRIDSAVKSTLEEQFSAVRDSETYDKTILKKIFPCISISDTLGHKVWMSSFEKQAVTYISSLSQKSSISTELESKYQKQLVESDRRHQSAEENVSLLARQLRETETRMKNDAAKIEDFGMRVAQEQESRHRAELQVQEYRSVLGETEGKLQQLQNSVEAEEKKWRGKVEATETELQQIQNEVESLRKEVKQQKGSVEMEIKVTTLEAELSGCKERCIQLNSQLDQSQRKINKLETNLQSDRDRYSDCKIQLDKAHQDISVLQMQINKSLSITTECEDLRKLIKELEGKIAEEQKKKKDLAQQLVKLNGIIKTGQDALAQEQNIVAELRRQLEEKNKSSVGPSSLAREAEQLKTKLAEKEKQLERETLHNKQLSQRLPSAGGDSGTQV